MANYSDVETDRKLNNLEKKIKRVYRQAYAEMKNTADEYFSTLVERYEKEYKAYQEGKYTEAEFKAWYRTQIERGKGYRKMQNALAERMVEANQVASAYINDDTPTIYSLNANYLAYEIVKITESVTPSISFQIYDEQTVKRLIEGENAVNFKTVSVNPERDYEWNSKQISRALTSGILQGKDIYSIADSYMVVMKRNQASAIRNARTSYTSAQNGGRVDTLNRAIEQGIKAKKKWVATNDERTRLSHALLNGQVREANKTFSNGLMYPADPDGAPAEVYNCRCTLTYVLTDYENVISNEKHTEYSQMSKEDQKKELRKYKEWLKEEYGNRD